MSLKIKFSHRYAKMVKCFERSMLLAVFDVRLEELGADFLDYDTTFLDADGEVGGRYPLPARGDYMVLLLMTAKVPPQIWTTIRRRTAEKEAYYRKNIGQIFECVVIEP